MVRMGAYRGKRVKRKAAIGGSVCRQGRLQFNFILGIFSSAGMVQRWKSGALSGMMNDEITC